MTTYTDVTADDQETLAFLCAHAIGNVNLYHLPVKMWVAKDETGIVALLMLKTVPYLSLDLIVAHPETRPFMRILRLWQTAEKWLKAQNVPMVATSVFNTLQHYQSLLRRMGWVKIGEELDDNGTAVETIYGKTFQPEATERLSA